MARDYKREYANYHSRPDQIKRRAARNAARRAMRGRKELTDEKDVHHKDNNPMNNDKSNLSIVTKHYNRREPRLRVEDLRKWFGKGKKGDWVRVGTDGEIKGDCAREPGEGKPKCMPRSKAHSMDKKDRASSARRKRRADPSVDRPGTGNKPIMVKTDKKESVEMNEEVYISREYEGGEDYKMDQKRIMTAIRKAGGKGEVNDTPDRRHGGMLSIIATGTTGDKVRRALGRDDGLTNIDEGTEMNEETAIAHQTPYGTVTAYKRDTKGMRGKQDGFKLTLKTKSGKTVDLGSHPKPTKANMSIVKNVMQKESVDLEENKIFFVRVGKGADSMVVKYKGANSREVLKKAKARHFGDPVRLDPNQKQGQPAGALESVALDELSPSTVGSYINKRTMGNRGIGTDTTDRSKSSFQAKARAAKKAGDQDAAAKHTAKAKKIGQGLSRAVARHHSQRTGTDHLKRKSVVKRVPQAYKDRAKHGPTQNPLKAVGESVNIEEKNVPTNPSLWAKTKAQAKAKFDVYPSAYANGWAAKKYKAAGGGWKTESVKEMKTFWDIREGSCGTMNAQTKKDEKPPFEPTRKVGVKKDRFGNVVKDKNRAKHLAKLAMRGENKK
jgi:hypothetical protein